MRLIGHLPNETSALTFSDFLYVQGIHNQVEHENDGWGVWILSEDELDKAKDFLDSYVGNPNDPRFHKHARRASQLKEQEIKEDQVAKEKTFDRTTLFKSSMPYGIGPVTVLIIAISVGASGLALMNPDSGLPALLMMSNYRTGGLREIMTGELWRLFTPVLLHGGWLHLFFNMWWLLDLGSMIEGRQSSRNLLALILVTGILSNLTQYSFAGPGFLGMSGVVYGLFGYVWIKGKYDPSSGLFLHPQIVLMMMIWFFACWFKLIPNVANYAHTGGLVVGAAWGFISSFWARRR
jgi:GlpG protein